MIYKANGDNTAAYDANGNPLSKVYDADGNLLSSKADYSHYSISRINPDMGTAFMQGVAYSKGTIFQLNGDTAKTINIDSWHYFSEGFTLSGAGHGQSAMFSRRYYDPADSYPLLYVSPFASTPTVKVYRMTETSGTLAQTLTMPVSEVGYWPTAVIDTDDPNIMYVVGYTQNDGYTDVDGTNFIQIAKYDLSRLTDNGDGSYSPEMVSKVVSTNWFYVIQGATFYDGHVWISSGGTGTSQYIYALDPETGELAYTINIGNQTETEGCAWVTDDGGEPWLLIAQQHMVYQKCTFA